MNRSGFILSCVLIAAIQAHSQSFIQATREMPAAGFVRGGDTKEYRLSLHIGLEQWEGEKKSRIHYQIWHLSCTNPLPSYTPSNRFDTFCHLERTFFRLWALDETTKPNSTLFPSTVAVIDHSMSDDTLKIRRVNWEQGILELSAMHTGAFDPEGSKIDISIRLKYIGIGSGPENHSTIFLRSLKAIDIAYGVMSDGTVAALEYRVPEYSYMLEAPFKIKGFKSREQKKRDDLARSLNDEDRLKWRVFMDGPEMSQAWTQDIATILPDFDPQQESLTKEQRKVVGEHILKAIVEALVEQGFSDDGRRKLEQYFAKRVLQAFDN